MSLDLWAGIVEKIGWIMDWQQEKRAMNWEQLGPLAVFSINISLPKCICSLHLWEHVQIRINCHKYLIWLENLNILWVDISHIFPGMSITFLNANPSSWASTKLGAWTDTHMITLDLNWSSTSFFCYPFPSLLSEERYKWDGVLLASKYISFHFPSPFPPPSLWSCHSCGCEPQTLAASSIWKIYQKIKYLDLRLAWCIYTNSTQLACSRAQPAVPLPAACAGGFRARYT